MNVTLSIIIVKAFTPVFHLRICHLFTRSEDPKEHMFESFIQDANVNAIRELSQGKKLLHTGIRHKLSQKPSLPL